MNLDSNNIKDLPVYFFIVGLKDVLDLEKVDIVMKEKTSLNYLYNALYIVNDIILILLLMIEN